MTVWYAGQNDLHTRWSSTHSDIYQVSHWYNWFSWWWAYGSPKHVENRNKHVRKNCPSSWFICKDSEFGGVTVLWNIVTQCLIPEDYSLIRMK